MIRATGDMAAVTMETMGAGSTPIQNLNRPDELFIHVPLMETLGASDATTSEKH
jgi:hypothetical protein